MTAYPKWLYHHERGAKLVHDQSEKDKLGSGWVDTFSGDPKAVSLAQADYLRRSPPKASEVKPEPTPAPEKKPQLEDLDRDSLLEIAKNHGLNFHHKTGKAKILAALEEHLSTEAESA